ncbi:DUF3995 domain-containing protein [Rugosimonospora africana]|uniref:DUF3995 domain-containing protein n=1 Tax=Rugosimonospora africana TaxID=556532 RepID=A0A8J3QSQ2_9ACTN|nr:DUF3995 domain-containing protein [Rugosimonospora africana]GIH15050.1 hypothetical protein Raf01_32220 [Rugosimonospora africana]
MVAERTHDEAAPARLSRSLRSSALAALAWVIVFIGFHVYWYLGGTFGFGDSGTTVPHRHSFVARAFGAIVIAMFVVGTVLPFALFQRWGSRVPRWMLHTAVWTGGVLLAVRGAAGLLDTALRETGLSGGGLTGMSYEQVTGDANPSAYTVLSGSAIDAYFFLGGVLFGWAALCFWRVERARRLTRPAGRPADPQLLALGPHACHEVMSTSAVVRGRSRSGYGWLM